jgi:hypothetical protein
VRSQWKNHPPKIAHFVQGFITEVVDDEFFQAAADIAEIIVEKSGRAVLHALFVEDWLREDLIGGAGGADIGITVADLDDPVIIGPEMVEKGVFAGAIDLLPSFRETFQECVAHIHAADRPVEIT